jgi:hypothetical protein
MKKRPGRARTYPDPFDFERHRCWIVTRNQCLFRGEGWDISIQEFFDIWPRDLWIQRGRTSTALVMTRHNPALPWTPNNLKIVDRAQQLREKNQRQRRARVQQL